MKVAIIGNIPQPLHDSFYRGVERFIVALARKLHNRGHKVVVYSGNSELPCRSRPILTQSETTQISKLNKHPATNWKQIEEIKRQAYLRVMRDVAANNYDIVHNNSLDTLPLLASKKLNMLMLTTFHAPPSAEQVYMFSKMKEDIGSYFCASSHHVKNIWKQKVGEIDIAVIRNGVLDIEEEVTPARKNVENKALWVGRIRPEKGLHHAIKACHMAGVSLSFSGTVDDKNYFEKTIIPLMGNNDEYLGNLTKNRLKAAMETARVGVATPNKNDVVGIGPVHMLSCGLPVVSYKAASLSEILNESNGYLARPNDPMDLAIGISQIQNLSKNKIKEQTLKKFNLETMVLKYERVYNFLRNMHEKDRKEQAYWYLYSSSKQGTLA